MIRFIYQYINKFISNQIRTFDVIIIVNLFNILVSNQTGTMTTEIIRKLYKRGSSFETTIPMPLLFAIDKTKKQNVIFKYDPPTNRWYIEFEPRKEGKI